MAQPCHFILFYFICYDGFSTLSVLLETEVVFNLLFFPAMVGFTRLNSSPMLALFPLNPLRLLLKIEMSTVFPADLLPLLSFLLLLLLLPLLVSFTASQPAASGDQSPPASGPPPGPAWFPAVWTVLDNTNGSVGLSTLQFRGLVAIGLSN